MEHLIVRLLNRSEFFRVMFNSGMKETQQNSMLVEGFEARTIINLLRWLYSDEMSDEYSLDDIIELLQAANLYLNDPRLKEICSLKIIQGVDVENVAYV